MPLQGMTLYYDNTCSAAIADAETLPTALLKQPSKIAGKGT